MTIKAVVWAENPRFNKTAGCTFPMQTSATKAIAHPLTKLKNRRSFSNDKSRVLYIVRLWTEIQLKKLFTQMLLRNEF